MRYRLHMRCFDCGAEKKRSDLIPPASAEARTPPALLRCRPCSRAGILAELDAIRTDEHKEEDRGAYQVA